MHDLAGQRGTPASSLRALREDHGVDQTFQNVLRALTLSLELRSRYRVFEFEATQDGHGDTATLFRTLRAGQDEQIDRLMAGLHARLGSMGLGDTAD
jgi:hypothetical protein